MENQNSMKTELELSGLDPEKLELRFHVFQGI